MYVQWALWEFKLSVRRAAGNRGWEGDWWRDRDGDGGREERRKRRGSQKAPQPWGCGEESQERGDVKVGGVPMKH